MSSEGPVQHSELEDDAFSPSSKAHKLKEGEQQGSKGWMQTEQPEKPNGTQDRSDFAGQSQTSQQPQTDSTDTDLPSLQEYIARLPEALIPEFALLLAQRMK
jgi:hypothetical protein